MSKNYALKCGCLEDDLPGCATCCQDPFLVACYSDYVAQKCGFGPFVDSDGSQWQTIKTRPCGAYTENPEPPQFYYEGLVPPNDRPRVFAIRSPKWTGCNAAGEFCQKWVGTLSGQQGFVSRIVINPPLNLPCGNVFRLGCDEPLDPDNKITRLAISEEDEDYVCDKIQDLFDCGTQNTAPELNIPITSCNDSTGDTYYYPYMLEVTVSDEVTDEELNDAFRAHPVGECEEIVSKGLGGAWSGFNTMLPMSTTFPTQQGTKCRWGIKHYPRNVGTWKVRKIIRPYATASDPETWIIDDDFYTYTWDGVIPHDYDPSDIKTWPGFALDSMPELEHISRSDVDPDDPATWAGYVDLELYKPEDE